MVGIYDLQLGVFFKSSHGPGYHYVKVKTIRFFENDDTLFSTYSYGSSTSHNNLNWWIDRLIDILAVFFAMCAPQTSE
jgi:hypothetical protein